MSLAGPLVAVGLAVAGVEAEALIAGLLASAAAAALLASAVRAAGAAGLVPGGDARRSRATACPRRARRSSTRSAATSTTSSSPPACRPRRSATTCARFQLGSDYQSKISGILLRVAFPVLSRSRDLDEVRRIRARIIRVHAAVLFPLLFGLIALAPVFVPLVYGDAWEPAVELTQILAVAGLVVRARHRHRAAAARHRASARAVPSTTWPSLAAYVAGVLIAVPHGLLAVCWTVAGVTAVSFLVLQYAVVERVVGIPLLETLRDAVPALCAGLALLGRRLARRRRLLDPALPDLARPALAGAASARGLRARAARRCSPPPGATWRARRQPALAAPARREHPPRVATAIGPAGLHRVGRKRPSSNARPQSGSSARCSAASRPARAAAHGTRTTLAGTPSSTRGSEPGGWKPG